MYEICTLRAPFQSQDLKELVDKIMRGPLPRIPSTYPRELSEMCWEMFNRDAARRPTAAAILQQPLLQNEIKKMLAENRRDSKDPDASPVPSTPGRDRREHWEGGSVTPKTGRNDSERDVGMRVRHFGEHKSREPSPARGGELEVLRPIHDASPARGRASEVLRAIHDASPARGVALEVLKPRRGPSPCPSPIPISWRNKGC